MSSCDRLIRFLNWDFGFGLGIMVRLYLIAVFVIATAGCASLDPPRHGARDYAMMSCKELGREAKEAWRRKNERADLFAGKGEERLAADRLAAKQELKAIRSAAIAKNCLLPG